MTLRYMKIFVSVYEHNSITKAADVLHLAQPSVSLAIKEMEEYYGTRFFELDWAAHQSDRSGE